MSSLPPPLCLLAALSIAADAFCGYRSLCAGTLDTWRATAGLAGLPTKYMNETNDIINKQGQIESNYDETVDNFDSMDLKPELLRGTFRRSLLAPEMPHVRQLQRALFRQDPVADNPTRNLRLRVSH